MRFALINGDRAEPRPGLKGICEHCQSDTLAKCGTVRISHWAHKSKVSCDAWWENETEWHRAWKNHFPVEWQERIHIDSTTGEKHIADVKTAHDVVIEFQRSAIKPSEIKSRETFYKNMVWVIDGTRLKRDRPRFSKGSKDLSRGGPREFRSLMWSDIFFTYFPEECFPKQWLTSSVPVYFDFEADAPLWCLFPGDVGGWTVVAKVSRKEFMERCLNASHLLVAQDAAVYVEEQNQGVDEKERQLLEEQKRIQNQRLQAVFPPFGINRRRGRHFRL